MPDHDAVSPRNKPPCPICGRESRRDFRPFCSKRCADIDLGRWLGGRYAIPGEPATGDHEPEGGGPENGDSG